MAIRYKAVQVTVKVILAFVLHDRDQRRHLKISLFYYTTSENTVVQFSAARGYIINRK